MNDRGPDARRFAHDPDRVCGSVLMRGPVTAVQAESSVNEAV